MRLIDADNVRDLFDAEFKETRKLILAGETHLDNLAEGFTEADRVIREMPTVDAEVVTRCKGCKHYDMGVCLKIYSDGNVHAAAWQKRKPEDFCSYGERRDKQGCPRGQRGPLAVCPVCGGFDTSWNPDTDESFCKSCGFRT